MKNSIAASLRKNLGSGLIITLLLFSAPLAFGQGKEPVYEAVEYPAQPKGGYSGFQDYISRNLTYPTFSLRNKTQGTVEVAFIVEKNGTVSNAEVVKGLDESCNSEALRVIKNSPKWEPAKHNGQTVRHKITVPLLFTMPVQATAPAASAASTSADAPVMEDPNLKRVTPEMAAHPEMGTEDFFVYLKKNQKYPAKARKNQVQGRVMVEFVVEKDGSLSNLKVIQKMGSGLDEEAVRLIEKGPKWVPAQYNGQPIRQKMILPVIFQL